MPEQKCEIRTHATTANHRKGALTNGEKKKKGRVKLLDESGGVPNLARVVGGNAIKRGVDIALPRNAWFLLLMVE